MGLDISWVIELKTRKDWDGNHWVGVTTSYYADAPVTERWYGFFAELTGGEFRKSETAFELRGFPPDASELTKYLSSEYGYTLPSYLSLKDFVGAYRTALEGPCGPEQPIEENTWQNLFGEEVGDRVWEVFNPLPDADDQDMQEEDEYRVVFWFS